LLGFFHIISHRRTPGSPCSPGLAARMRFDAPVRVGWFRLSFCVADSDDKDIDIDDERFS